MDYLHLIQNIPKLWRDTIEENREKNVLHRYNVQINCYVFKLLRKKKGCRDIYDTLISANDVSVPNYWTTEIGDVSNDEWKRFSKNLIYIQEIKLRDFQYKINNRILVTNTFLYKIKKKDSNRCSYCNQEPETITHLLFHCKNVLDFWNTLKTWLQRTTNITLQIDLKKIIFSYPAQPLVSYIITAAKYFIYKSKFFTKNLSIKSFEKTF